MSCLDRAVSVECHIQVCSVQVTDDASACLSTSSGLPQVPRQVRLSWLLVPCPPQAMQYGTFGLSRVAEQRPLNPRVHVQVVGRAEPHNLALIHPEQCRVLSIRENARCQARRHA